MARFEFVQTNFTAGELSPRLKGRLDFNDFFNGVAEQLNFVTVPFGGVTRRPGTRFAAEVKDSSKETRLIPFQFSTVQSYACEFSEGFIRFYRDEGQLVDGGSPVEVSGTPYVESDMPELKFTQSADILYIVHGDHEPQELQRLSDTNWQLVDFDFEDGPYLSQNDTSTTLTPSGTSGSVTITASSTTGINDGDGFKSTDVGRLIRFKASDGTWFWMEITAHTDSTNVTATIKAVGDTDTLPNTNARETWRLGAWSDTTGWPQVVTFHDERLVFAASDDNPQTVWASRSGDFTNFAPSDDDGTVADDHGFTITLASDQVNAVRWMLSSARGLLIGTADGEAVVTAATTTDPLGPNSVTATFQTNRGSVENALPTKVGHSVVYLQRGAQTLREYIFDFNVDGFISRDLSILSEHLLRSGGAAITYQQNPDSTLWIPTEDGEIITLTFERDQNVFAWAKQVIGGEFSGGQAVVESAVTIVEATQDQVWLIVKRTIDGQTKRYVEFVEDFYDETIAQEDAVFVDSSLEFSGSATDTISGLDHLEGEEVAVLADGSRHPNVTVSSGSITLDREVTKAQVGLQYTSRVKTMPIEQGVSQLTTRGKIKRTHKIHIQVWNALGLEYGENADDLTGIPLRSSADEMNEPVPLFTGMLTTTLRMRHTIENAVVVQTDQAFPADVLSITITLEFGGSK